MKFDFDYGMFVECVGMLFVEDVVKIVGWFMKEVG